MSSLTGIDFLYESLGMLAVFSAITVFLLGLYYFLWRPMEFAQRAKKAEEENARLKEENASVKRDFDILLRLTSPVEVAEERSSVGGANE